MPIVFNHKPNQSGGHDFQKWRMHELLSGLLLPLVVDSLRPLKKATSSVPQIYFSATDVTSAIVQQASMCYSSQCISFLPQRLFQSTGWRSHYLTQSAESLTQEVLQRFGMKRKKKKKTGPEAESGTREMEWRESTLSQSSVLPRNGLYS